MTSPGTQYEQGTWASSGSLSWDVLSYDNAHYMVYLFDDSSPADGEIGFHAEEIIVTSACDDCESGRQIDEAVQQAFFNMQLHWESPSTRAIRMSSRLAFFILMSCFSIPAASSCFKVW